MKKRTITEVLLEECPNCGAARKGDEEVCTFCGTSMVQTQRVFEEIEETPQKDERKYDNRKVDIISEVEPAENAKSMTVGVIFLAVWCAIAFGIGVMSLGGDAPAVFVIAPFLMGAFGVVVMWSGVISPALRTKRVLSEGREYCAEVIGYGRKTVERSYGGSNGSSERTEREEEITIKVLATIDGREQCILLKAPESVSELSHPVGCMITIIGYGNDYLMKTDR